MTSSFVSYVSSSRPVSSIRGDSRDDVVVQDVQYESKLEPMLLPGELVIASAQRVLKFTALSEQKQGIIGSLFVTNFKLSFVTATTSYKLVDQSQQNALLGPNDVCLINIDSVHQVSESTHKRRKLELGSNLAAKVKLLQVICKDFRVFTFSFKFALLGEDRGIANALLHHACPSKSQLLFAYEYKERRVEEPEYFGPTRMFNNPQDWEYELDRLQCQGWRVTSVNRNFMSKTQPPYYVVPMRLLDSHLTSAASHYPGYRIPFWCWGNKKGCVIVRSACHTRGMYSHQIYEFIKAIKQIHPLGRDPRMVDVEETLPTPREIYQRFSKLKELCTPESSPQFWEQDSKFNSLLEATQWLPTVATCLSAANFVVNVISSHRTSVVLQETEDRDLSCLVSSLAQIMLDPYFRTISGFQNLVQKEWVAMGHPFLTRLGRVKVDSSAGQESPIFLLFLDCVWQMTEQFPASFEFTDTYLTTVWDSTQVSIFDTYLFNSELERRRAAVDPVNPLMLRRVWDWNRQYSRKQTSLFFNPLYWYAEEVHKNMTAVEKEAPVPAPRRHSTFSPIQYVNKPQVPPRNHHHHYNHEHNGHSPNHVKALAPPTSPLSSISTICNFRLAVDHLPDVKQNFRHFLSNWPRYDILSVKDDLMLIKCWRLCYFRWMPLVQVVGGGPPVAYMEQCRITKDIRALQRKISDLVRAKTDDSRFSPAADLSLSTITLTDKVPGGGTDFDSSNGELLTSAYPYSPGGTNTTPGLPLSFFRLSSYIASDGEDDGESDD